MTRFEVREFAGAVRYSGEDRALAEKIYQQYAATQAAVAFYTIEPIAETPEYIRQRELVRGSVPWSR